MNYLVWGILTITVCTASFYIAWRNYKINKLHISLIFIVLSALLMRLYVASDGELHTWDERYHALVAKNLVKHPLKPTLYDQAILPYDYTNWIGNHIWLEKGPVPLWSMAVSIRLFGVNEFAVRFPSLIISTLAVFLTFLIGYKLFDKRTGLLAAFFHAVNGLAIELASGRISSDHVETAFVFYTELAVFLCILSIIDRRSYHFAALTGVSIGLAVLCKWAPAFIVFPVWLIGAFLSKRFSLWQIFKHGSLMLICCLAVFLPWIFYILSAFPKEANWILKKFIFAYSNTVEGHSAPAYYYFQQIGIIFGELIYLPIILGIYFLFKRRLNWQLWLLNTWWIIPVVIFSMADTKRHTYILLFAPALFVIGAHYFFYLASLKPKFKYPKAISVALVLLILLPFRYGIDISKAFRKREEPEWSKQIKQLKYKISASDKLVVFNTDHYIEAMFYSDLTVYQNVPAVHEVDSLQKNNFSIYIIQDEKLDDRFIGNKDVKFIRLDKKQ